MGEVLLACEVSIEASPSTVFSLFGSDSQAGWLFGAEVNEVRPGAVVRLALPVSGHLTDPPVEGTARIAEVTPFSRIVLRHESPWTGSVIVTLREREGHTVVRVVASLDESSISWMGDKRGVDPEPAPPDAHAIRIGLLTCLSGQSGVFGRAVENCARLAVQEINAEGGVLGRPLHLVVADDGTDPLQARWQVERLLRSDRVHALVGSHVSRSYEAVRPAVRRAGIPYLYAPVNEGGSEPAPLFRLGEVPIDQLRMSVPALMRETGSSGWFLVGSDYCWPRRTGQCARDVVTRAGGRVLGERYLPFGERRFDTLLDEIASSGAQNIMSSFVGTDAVAFERAFYDAGLRAQTRTIGALIDETTREHIGDEAAAGIWSVFGYFSDLPTTENRSFVRRYRQEYGRWAPPVSTISECTFEAIHLFAAAAARATSIEPGPIGHALSRTAFRGPRGTVRLNSEGRLHQSLYLAEAVPGGFRVRQDLGVTGSAA